MNTKKEWRFVVDGADVVFTSTVIGAEVALTEKGIEGGAKIEITGCTEVNGIEFFMRSKYVMNDEPKDITQEMAEKFRAYAVRVLAA